MSQESLDFGPIWLVKDAQREIYRTVDEAVDAIGGIQVAAGACAAADVSIDRSDLRRSIDREGRRLAVEHAMAIAAMCTRSNPSLAERINSALIRPSGFVVATPPPRISDAELRKAYDRGDLAWSARAGSGR